jgi:hypothetical protein
MGWKIFLIMILLFNVIVVVGLFKLKNKKQ